MEIDNKDVFWNYGATFFKIASGILLLPLILRIMPTEMIGIWTVFVTITALTTLLDFGFSSSFTRNVTYIFSGVKNLQVQGFETVLAGSHNIDYGLLKGVIEAMRWFYLRVAIILFVILATFGTWYLYTLLQYYKGDQKEVYVAWIVLCLINTYNLYSLYYDSLLLGKGRIKRSKQIVIIGYTVYIVIAAALIFAGYGLIAIVSAQAFSVIIIRWLSYRSFFTHEIKQKLKETGGRHKNEVIKAIYPNALKIGLTSLGGFMVQKSAIIIGSLYLSLDVIASFGITMQLIAVIAALAGIYTGTFQPKIAQLQLELNNSAIKEIYLKGQIVLFVTYLAAGLVLVLFGGWAINLIGSNTQLMPFWLMFLAILLSFEQSNFSIAGGILLSKNEVPFFKAAIISGMAITLGLFVFFEFLDWGVLTMLLVPLIVDVSYQAWKWPLEVKRELNINLKDLLISINRITKR